MFGVIKKILASSVASENISIIIKCEFIKICFNKKS